MDDIIQTVKLEVALDCEQGSTLSKVWSYVELAQRRLLQRNGMDSESVTVDDALKRYLWPFILKLPGMTFINDGAVIYEATSGSAAQSDAAKNFLALSVSETESRFPDLIMRASCKAINKVIFGREEGNEKLLRSTNSYKLIQEISRSREKGVTQVQLSKIFGLDPRSTFHFIKNIDGEGLLSKSVTYDSGNTTNLWVLRRFASDRQGTMDKSSAHGSGNSMEPAPIPNEDSASLTAYFVSNDLRKRASDILEAAGPQYMPETDLMDALKLDIWSKRHRKYFHRVLRDLSEQGVAEKVQLQLPDADLSGFQPEMYRPVADPMDVDESGDDNAEPATNALDDDGESGAGEANAEDPEAEAPESTGSKKTKGGAKKTKGKAKKPVKIKRTREENQANRVKRERIGRGLAVGHSYRRCVRFIKPYVEKGSVRTRLGVPLEQSTRAVSNTLDGGDGDAAMANPDDADIEGGDDSSSDDDDELDVETMKDKDDILYVMKNHSVQVGALATLPPEAQVFRLIALSGSHGIVSRAIQFLLKWVSLKHLARCLIHLEQTPVFLPDGSWPGVYTSEKCKRENREHMDERLVISVEEFMGREHRKRFFVNPLAKMAIASLTAHSDRAVTQPSTLLPQLALPTQSPAASDSAALATAAASGNRDDSSAPSSREPAMPTAQPETQSPAPVAATLTPEAELVLADMAKFNSFSDIYAEAKERGVPVNTIIRECVILGMLRQESVFACNTEQVVRCDQLVKSYVMANRDSPVMTPTLSKSLLKFSMDKRTFQRIVSSLADQNRLWTQDVYSLPDAARPSTTTKVQIAIARDTDPAGPVVHTFIAQIRDLRKLNKQNPITVARRITDIVPVVRTEGAEERDRDFLLRKMDTDESRARGVKNFSLKHPLGRKYVDSNSPKRPRDSQGYAIVKRAKVSLVENTAKDRPLEDWDLVYKRLQHIPRRIGRAKNLYDYLANNLADNVDDTYVYENCAFRSSFLFYRLPLELLLQITGGIAYFQDLLPFIRYGICTRVDARTHEAAEAQIVEAQNSEASSLESINLRLATPINMLPPIVSEIIESKVVRARLHIQSLIYALYILQLLRPVDTARDIVSMPPPPDAKDAFSSVPVASPKILGFGYQLIGKARILNKKGYDLALDAYNNMAKHRLDLTTCYLDTNVYDMTNKDGAFSYWSNLHMSAMTEAKHLPSTHILFGIGLPYYWILDVSLDGRQTKVLQSYVDERQFLTPLDDPNLLADAAKRAGTTLEEARRYFQHQHSEMAKKSSKCKAYHVSRERYVKKRVERAKAIEVERRKQAKANGDANGGTNGEASGDVGSSGKKQRVRWTENDSTRVMVWYAVMRHHANMHDHMFVLLNIGELFPNRGLNIDPSDSARHHWQRIQHNPKLKLKSDKIHCVWKYVFRDAVERGDLDDSEDLNSFDAKAAVYYYCSKILNESLDGLVSRYADDLDEDDVVFEPVDSSGKPAQSKPTTGKSKPTVVDNEPPEYEESEASEVSEAGGNLIFRLPATLQGKESRYKIKLSSRTRAAGTKGFEFTEDTLRENLSVKTREQNGSGVMLTTHSGWECATDHFYPSTIVLSIRPNGVASNSMEVDGETPTPAAAVVVKGEPIVATRGSSYVPYRDTMGRRRHVKRKFDASELVSRISELALGGDIDPEGDRVPRAELGKLGRPKLYAELASLQAMIVNLAITPDDEYDVVTGHRLLESKRNVANDAYRLAKSNSTLTRLSNMSASAGLSLQLTATAPVASAESAEAPPGSAEPTAGALTSLTNALKSTTVAYETTGMTRIKTKPGTTRSVANRSGANDVDDSINEDANADDEPAVIDTPSRSDRKVPGRGHAVSDKFMGAIKPTHADRFASLREFFGAADSMLNGHLGHAAFERLCWLVGQGKLWLRPEYGSDMHESLLSGMGGVKNQQDNAVAADFIVKAAYVDRMAGMEVDASQVDDVYKRSTSKSVYTALLPTGDSLAVVSRVVTGIIHEMGAMGASEYELFAILVVLFESNAYKTTLAALPNELCSVLSTRSQLSALLHLLALEGKVHIVGSNDLRYVSNDAYRKYWSLTLEGIERTFEPYLGQNMSGSVNTTFTLGMLTSLVSHIVDNPGIPQFMLVRRFFAPVIPKKEVLSYLGQLIDMGLVVTENIKSDVLMVKDQAWSAASSTHYFMAPDYRHRIAQLPFTWVASHLNKGLANELPC